MEALALAWTLFGISVGGLFGVLIAFMTGAIVAGTRLERAETAANLLREAYDTLKIPVHKFDIESDLLGAVLRANHAVATGVAPAPLPPTTSSSG